MSEVRTEITLVNLGDAVKARDGIIPESEVRRLTVNAVVDTGVHTMTISEATREKLGLEAEETSNSAATGWGAFHGQVTDWIKICWKDRDGCCDALVLPDGEDIIMGQFALLALDLKVDPDTQQVVGAHGDKRWNVVK